jgi:hypothetical protein
MPQNLSTNQVRNEVLNDTLEESRHVRKLERWSFWFRSLLAVTIVSSGVFLLVIGRAGEGALVALSGLILQLARIERVKRG